MPYAELSDAPLLDRLYTSDGYSIIEIAEMVGCSVPAVSMALKRHGITTRGGVGQRHYKTRQCALCGHDFAPTGSRTTECADCKAQRAVLRSSRRAYFWQLLDREWLSEQYITNRLTTTAIGDLIGCSSGSVSYALKQAGIPIRQAGEEPKVFPARTCAMCDSVYEPSGPAARFCPACGLQRRANARQQQRRQRVDLSCENCGQHFAGFDTARFCSPRCRRVAAGEKHCTRCKRTLPITSFRDDASRHDGFDATCSECRTDKRRAAHRRDPDAALTASRAYYDLNKAKWKEYARAARERDPEKWLASARRRRQRSFVKKMGWDPGVYDRLFTEQEGRCAICAKEPAPEFLLSIDHDHATGAVRGLLCRACNLVIGNAEDDPVVLRAALTYLDRFRPS